MKLTKSRLRALIRTSIIESLLQEAQGYADPMVLKFDQMLQAIETVGSVLNVDDPVYPRIEELLMAAEDIYDDYVGDA